MKKFVIGVLILIVLIGGWFLHLLWSAGQFKTINSHYSGTCTPVPGITGAEDITIHPKTGVAYISSCDRRSVRAGGPGKGAIYAYDLTADNPEPVLLTPEASEDFRPHGISLFVGEDGQNVLFVVNHEREIHHIDVFDVLPDVLIPRDILINPMILSPNDIVAVGPDSFYFTNDHGNVSGTKRSMEDYLRLKNAGVVFYDGQTFKEVASGIGYANGINISPDKKTLYVAAATEGAVIVYDINSADGSLTFREKINLGTGVDNIEIDSKGDLWIGAHPQMLAFVRHAKNPADISPSQVLHVSFTGNGHYEVSEVYLNDGKEISGSSVAAVYANRMLIGPVFDPKFLDCRSEK